MRNALILAAALAAFAGPALAQETARSAVIHKDPYCGCCDGHAEHLRQNGYQVTVKQTDDLAALNKALGIPEQLQGCHATLIGGYAISGHVPVSVIDRLLAEKPEIRGIALPGMPAGSPGMGGEKSGPFTIYRIDGDHAVFAVE